MAVLVLFFSLIYLRDTSSGKFRVLVIPSPGSVVMDTEYEGEATVSMNSSLSSYKLIIGSAMLDSRLKGGGYEPNRRHCIISLSKTH